MISSLSLGRLVLLSWLWLLATLVVDAGGATLYSLYDIPPFAVTFQTQPTDALEAALRQLPSGETLVSETNGRSSGLSFPLRSVTQAFLYQEFKAKIISLEDQENAMDPAQQYEWFPIYAWLVGVDLTVRLYWVEGGTFQNDSRGRHRDRRLSSQVTLRAECYGLLAFQESQEPTPSNEQVMQMFGDWMELIFSQHRDAYLRDLVQSEYDLLRQIAALDIATNIGSASESSSVSTETSWSDRTQKALLTMLILLAVAALAYSTLVVHQTLRKRRLQTQRDVTTFYEDEEEYDFSIDRPAPIHNNLRSASMDAVRHGPDVFHRSSYSGAMSVLEHTDKYLAKHRPDLYQPETSNNNFSLLGREYTIPSNPFEFIYNAFSEPKDFVISPQGAFSAPRRMPPSRSENIAAMRPLDEVEEDELHLQEHQHERDQPWKTQSMGYRPISSIWRNITTMWDYDTVRPRLNEDGIVNHTPQRSVDMELQTVNFVDMDEGDYDFAFKDFPRHDGTPCLIFNDGATLTSKQREIFEIGSPVKNDEKNDLLSDEEFQRMLAQQGNASPNESMIDTSFQDQDSNYTDFKEKLTRLMQQKHRQYEKRAIVEKHQERRAKERKSVRELEKQEKHKAIERQIDDLEAAFTNNTLAKEQLKHSPKSARWTNSPNPYVAQRYSPKPTTQQSPYRHSTYSPYLNGNASGASPFRTSNPSPNIVNRSSPNTSIDFKGVRYRPSSNSPLQDERGHASMPSIGMEDSRPFRMRPRTSHPLHATTGPSDLYMDPFAPPTNSHQLDNSMDHNTLDKLSMPPMTINGNNNNPKYPSPNSVNDDIFAGAPTSISRRKATAGTTVPKPVHRRVNSMDNKLGFDRPVPQQRRKTKVNKQRTSTPTRDHSLPRSSTPNQRSMTAGPLTPLTGLARREPSFSAQDHHSSASSLSSTKRGSTLSRSNSFNTSEDNIFTHGFASQSRFV